MLASILTGAIYLYAVIPLAVKEQIAEGDAETGRCDGALETLIRDVCTQ